MIVELAAEVDEVGLSLLGWEVLTARIRLKIDDFDSEAYCDIAASVELRFHEEDWQVQHQSYSESLPSVLWQLRSRSKGPLSAYSEMLSGIDPRKARAPMTVSDKSRLWRTETPIDVDDLYVWIGGVDWVETGSLYLEPGMTWSEVPIEVINHIQFPGLVPDFQELRARTRDEETLEVTVQAVHRIGSPDDLMSAATHYSEWSVDPDLGFDDQEDFEVPCAAMRVEVYDETGFLLDYVQYDTDYIVITEGGSIPKRAPRSIYSASFSLDRLPGIPHRIVLRLEDAIR